MPYVARKRDPSIVKAMEDLINHFGVEDQALCCDSFLEIFETLVTDTGGSFTPEIVTTYKNKKEYARLN